MANLTAERGACTAPFLQLSNFDTNAGYVPGRFCAPVPSIEGIIECCLPCPITDWVYSNEFDVVPKAAGWLNVVGMACSVSLLITYLILPVKNTNRHYLTIGLVLAVCCLQLGFIIPLAAQPDQCHDVITPNDMYSDRTCAFSGAFLLFGGFAAITWGFLRSVSIHLQICWQVVPGTKFFWASLLTGLALPATFATAALAVTGTSYRFGNTCHINHQMALADYWGPLLGFAAFSTILQFATFGYCIKVYIKSLFADDHHSNSQVSSSGLPSYSSRAGSVKTVTAGQAYRRIRKVIALQWRGTVIVLIIIINVVFLSIVFVQMDNTVTAAMQDLGKAEPWLLCLVINGGNKNACLDKVEASGLVTNEATVMAVLIMLSLNGIWTLLFLGRTSMLLGWIDLLCRPFAKRPTDFVSVDARRFSNSSKNYEMINSPPSRSGPTPRLPEAALTSNAFTLDKEDDLSPLGESPQSPSSRYASDYFSKEIDYKPSPNFGKDADYQSPKLSFSTPRPPSSVGAMSRSRENSMIHSQRVDGWGRPLSPPREESPASLGRAASRSRGRSFTPTYEWDPASTHAKPVRRQGPYGF